MQLTRNELRVLYLREAKLAARVWDWLNDDVPTAVTAHLSAITNIVEASFAELSDDDQDMVLKTYVDAARDARGPADPSPADWAAIAPETVRARISQMHDEARDVMLWAQPSSEVAAIVERLVSEPSSAVSPADARALYSEVGRLAGPLWMHGTADDFPRLPDLAINVLAPIVQARWEAEPIFDERSATFTRQTFEDAEEALNSALLGALHASRATYYAAFPLLGALPHEPEARAVEERRRAAERRDVVRRASAAIDIIVDPIQASFTAYLEQARVQMDEAAVAARREAGFERPEPQRYGVSPRGAELWVTDALRWLGLVDAEVTRQSQDGGADIVSGKYAVSVKHYAGSVPVEEVREILGAAIANGLSPALWTSGTLTGSGAQFADLAPVPVVRYYVESGTWEALNAAGEKFLAELSEA